jgi:hypothetical protein
MLNILSVCEVKFAVNTTTLNESTVYAYLCFGPAVIDHIEETFVMHGLGDLGGKVLTPFSRLCKR